MSQSKPTSASPMVSLQLLALGGEAAALVQGLWLALGRNSCSQQPSQVSAYGGPSWDT